MTETKVTIKPLPIERTERGRYIIGAEIFINGRKSAEVTTSDIYLTLDDALRARRVMVRYEKAHGRFPNLCNHWSKWTSTRN